MKTKVCTKCGKRKNLNEFHRYYRSKDGHRTRCVTCIAEDTKIYRQIYAEALKKRKHKYHVENRIAINARKKKYRVQNAEKVKRQKQISNARHSKQNVERARLWKINNRDRCNKWSRDNLSRRRLQLADTYIKTVLVVNTSLCFADIPQELIELKREHVKLGRLLKEGIQNEDNERCKKRTG